MEKDSIICNTVLNKYGLVLCSNPNNFMVKVKLLGSDEIKDWPPEDCVQISESETKKEKSHFESLAEEIGTLVTEKNKAYGNSFLDAEKFLTILFPNGIPKESYSDMLCIVRIFDKLKRIATSKNAYNESPYRDLAGYALLGLYKDEILGKKTSE